MYEIRTIQSFGETVWAIYETASSQVIRTFPLESEARKHAKFLNLGGAFSGFTPTFMLTEYTEKNDLDESFSLEFA